MSGMLKSMLIHQKDGKGIVKSNFVTSCLAFRGSIPTYITYHGIILQTSKTILVVSKEEVDMDRLCTNSTNHNINFQSRNNHENHSNHHWKWWCKPSSKNKWKQMMNLESLSMIRENGMKSKGSSMSPLLKASQISRLCWIRSTYILMVRRENFQYNHTICEAKDKGKLKNNCRRQQTRLKHNF